MDDWDGFYALTGGTAGTLIGLIFVVITLGMDHAKEGDTDRIRRCRRCRSQFERLFSA